MNDLWYGVLLNLIGSLTINGATNLMKLGVVRRAEERAWRIVWYVGASLFAAGNLLNFRSLSLAPQTLLAALGAVQFVSNVFFARTLLGEEVTRRTMAATATIVFGLVIAVLSIAGSTEQLAQNISTITDRYFDLDYIAYLLASLVAYGFLERTYRRLPDEATLRPACFAAASAIVGTQSVLQGKCLSTILSQLSAKPPWTVVAFSAFVLVTLVACQVFWLLRMQKGLALFAGFVIIPALQVFWTCFSILGGGIYFRELYGLRPLPALGFLLGLLLLLTGVAGLVEPPSEESKVREHRASIFLGANQVDFLEFAEDVFYDPVWEEHSRTSRGTQVAIENRRRTMRQSLFLPAEGSPGGKRCVELMPSSA